MFPTSAPPGLDVSSNSILGCPITLSPDRMVLGHRRNSSTGSLYSDDTDDTIDISDLEDDVGVGLIGFPLQRMAEYNTSPSGSSGREDEENVSEFEDYEELTALYDACMTARLETNQNADDGGSDSSGTSSIGWDDVDFEQLVDSLSERYTRDGGEVYVQLHPSSYPALSAPITLHTLRLSANPNPLEISPFEDTDDSLILLLLLALNTPELRSDPWNPVPRILRAVERVCGDVSSKEGAGSTVYLFHSPLVPLTQQSQLNLDKQENGTLAQWIDFFRQVLEGLAFLHENGVVWGGFDAIEPRLCSTAAPSRPPGLDSGGVNELEMFMMDISSDPGAFASSPGTEWNFDRSRYPVKYYFTDFRRARQISPPVISTPAPSPSSPFTKDVQSCGRWLQAVVNDIHPVHESLLPLTQAMVSGTFTADGARKLFEARARSLSLSRDKSLWDNEVPSVRWKPMVQPGKEFEEKSYVKRSKTIHVAQSRPGMGVSHTRVTEASTTTKHTAFSTMDVPPPAHISRSKSNPIPIPQENSRKDVFGDLSFVKSVDPGVTTPVSLLNTFFPDEPVVLRSAKSKESDSDIGSTTTLTKVNSPAPSRPLSFLNPNPHAHAKVPPTPVFTIPSLATFPSRATLPSLPELSLQQHPEQHYQHHQHQPPTSLLRRKTLALGTGLFSRKALQYAPSLGGPGSSNSVAAVVDEESAVGLSSMSTLAPTLPTPLMKIGRSISMPISGSETWTNSQS
ncbi:hypothetical protein C8J55DRAFT_500068 [Lentinula edodes]|uniref:Uncharacterized protein n=1 Tax=Lentinula lateritia TaxID=40482 RepID=A0A9W9E0E1_9AGAR|nr:hypothetical protein C8J55DRAFT_500068 [Lentinula edodes]